MKEAYEAGKYGFVPDYARLDIVYQYGGLYFDTDVELIKNIDDMLYNESFFGFGCYGRVATGLGFGAHKGNSAIKRLLDSYQSLSFLNTDGTINCTTNTIYEEPVFKELGIKQKDQFQYMKGGVVFPSDFMSPCIPGFSNYKISHNTISIHRNAFTWANTKQQDEMKKSMTAYDNIRLRFVPYDPGKKYNRVSSSFRLLRRTWPRITLLSGVHAEDCPLLIMTKHSGKQSIMPAASS